MISATSSVETKLRLCLPEERSSTVPVASASLTKHMGTRVERSTVEADGTP